MAEESWSASRSFERGMVPGRLLLTATHVVFEPGRMAKRTAGLRFSVRLEHVAGAGTAPGTGRWLSGGKRERLCVTLGDGSEHLFVMADPDVAATAIRTALGR